MVHVLVVHPSVLAMTDLVSGQVHVMFTAYATRSPSFRTPGCARWP